MHLFGPLLFTYSIKFVSAPYTQKANNLIWPPLQAIIILIICGWNVKMFAGELDIINYSLSLRDGNISLVSFILCFFLLSNYCSLVHFWLSHSGGGDYLICIWTLKINIWNFLKFNIIKNLPRKGLKVQEVQNLLAWDIFIFTACKFLSIHLYIDWQHTNIWTVCQIQYGGHYRQY